MRSNFRKTTGLLLTVGVAVTLFTGCSNSNTDPNIEEVTFAPEISYQPVEYETEPTSVEDYSEEWWKTLPAVTDVTENSFVLLYITFKDCPNVIEEINYAPNRNSEDFYRLKVTYFDHDGEDTCALEDDAKVQFTATKIMLKDIIIPTTGNIAFESDLPDTPIMTPVPYFSDKEAIKFFEENQTTVITNPEAKDLPEVTEPGNTEPEN